MVFDATQLLKRLEPAVRPVGSRAASVTAPIEQQSFDQLLSLVAAGTSSTGHPVQCDCDLDPVLSDEQLSRLAHATDRALAAGSRRAVMLIDGRGVVVDVAARMIESELESTTTNLATSIDAAVLVASEHEVAAHIAPPGYAALPRSIADQLERAAQDRTI